MQSRASLKVLLILAMPMVLSRATQSVMTFADALMVEHLGPQAIAASATGGFNAFLVMILPMGTVFIVQSFVAQLVGAGDRDATPRFAWYGLIISGIAGVISIGLIPAIDPLLLLADFSPGLREQMSSYMELRMLSVAAVVGVEALGNWYGGLGNTWMALAASLISMAVDLFLNWVLIYGNLGAPEMGVDGAALSSTIGSFVGLAFLLVAFWRRWGMDIGGPAPKRAPPHLSFKELRRVVRFGLPNGVNWFLDFAAFQLFINGVFSSLGDEMLAAFNVVIAINSVSFMPAFGLASAGAILAGQSIGAGHHDDVWPQVKITLKVAGVWMGLIGALYFVSPESLLRLFDTGSSSSFVTVGATMLVISAAWQLFDAIGITLSETLRAAGDTTWTAVARLVLAWVVFVPMGFVVVRYWDGGPVGAMLCLVGYIALLAAAFAYRFKSGAWRKIQLIEPKLV
ncbi:MAG: MATE family efflux transporter [Deltaproteobacteria bacterium]|nr:MATE family efflux transporter [Deltaproteobacteria bacterium]